MVHTCVPITAAPKRDAPHLDDYFKTLLDLAKKEDAAENAKRDDEKRKNMQDMLQALQSDPEGFKKEKQAAKLAEYEAALTTIIEKAFDQHNTSKDGVLDAEESKVFFEDFVERYRQNAQDIYQAHAQGLIEKAISDNPALLDADGATRMMNVAKFQEYVAKTQASALQAKFQEYAANKEACDKAAFDSLDVNSDGKLVKAEVVKALIFQSPENAAFLEQFLTGPCSVGTAMLQKLIGCDLGTCNLGANAEFSCFDNTLGWAINFMSLAENVLTTLYFDEDRFGPIFLALVFCFEPVLDACVKQLMNCTECDWDNFIYDLISEGIQCYLYIYFCSFEENAVQILPILMAGQVFCMIVLKIKEKCSKQAELNEDQKEQLQLAHITGCVLGNIWGISTGIAPLFYLLYNEEAPFREKSFEVVLAVYYWVNDLEMQFNFQKIEAEAMRLGAGENGCLPVQGVLVGLVIAIARVVFTVYVAVLSWMYWFSGDCNEDFDVSFTMLTMIFSCTLPCSLPCMCLKAIPVSKDTAEADRLWAYWTQPDSSLPDGANTKVATVKAGTSLVARQEMTDGVPVFENMESSVAFKHRIAAGKPVIASGPPRVVEGYLMVPILPEGAVQLTLLTDSKGFKSALEPWGVGQPTAKASVQL